MSDRHVGWLAVVLLGTAVGVGTGCSERQEEGTEHLDGDAGSPGANGGEGGEAGSVPVAGEGGESAAGGEGGGNAGEAGQAGQSGGGLPAFDDPGLGDATFELSHHEIGRDGNYGPWLVYLRLGWEGSASLSLVEQPTGFLQHIALERRDDAFYSEPGMWSPLAVVRYDLAPVVPGDCARDWRVVPIDIDGDGGADQLNIAVQLDGDSDISSDYGERCGSHEYQRQVELVAKRIEPPPLTLKVLQDPGLRYDQPLDPLRPSVRPTRPLDRSARATLTTRTGTFLAKRRGDELDGFIVDVVQKPGDLAVWHVSFPRGGVPVPHDDPGYFAAFDVAFALPEWGVKVDGSFESYTEPSSFPKGAEGYYEAPLTTGLTGKVGMVFRQARLRVPRPEGGSRLKLLVDSNDVEMLAGAVGGVPGVPELLREVPCEENPLACQAPIFEYVYDLGEGDLGDEVLLRLRSPGTCYACAGETNHAIVDDIRVE